MNKRDYYEVLGVAKTATAEEVKRAYRKKAIELHPDKGGDAEKFKEVNEAYETLKDQSKRAQYDQFGHAASGGAGFNPFGGQGGFGGFEGAELDLDIGDIFGSFFGGGRGRGPRAARGQDVKIDVALDFKDAVFGITKKIHLNLNDVCDHCKGKQAEPGAKIEACKTCSGSGRVTQTQSTILGNIQHSSVCPTCQGRGEVPDKLCTKCGGKGVVPSQQEISFKIPPGVQDGATMRLAGKGEAVAGGAKGDLYVEVHISPHSKFKRKGNDITSTQTIELVEAVLGSQIEVQTIDGPVKMKVPSGTQSSQSFKLAEHGVPYGSRRGNHIVKLNVHIPKRLNKKQKDLLEEFARASGKKPFWQR